MDWKKMEKTAASRIAAREKRLVTRVEELIIQGMEMGLSSIAFQEESFLEIERILGDERLTIEATGKACGYEQKEWRISWS